MASRLVRFAFIFLFVMCLAPGFERGMLKSALATHSAKMASAESVIALIGTTRFLVNITVLIPLYWVFPYRKTLAWNEVTMAIITVVGLFVGNVLAVIHIIDLT